jgi:hypothetical protein
MTSRTAAIIPVADGVYAAIDDTGPTTSAAAMADIAEAASAADIAAAVAMPDWRAREFLAARGLLRDLLRLADVEPGASIAYRNGGQPYLRRIRMSRSASRTAARWSARRSASVAR